MRLPENIISFQSDTIKTTMHENATIRVDSIKIAFCKIKSLILPNSNSLKEAKYFVDRLNMCNDPENMFGEVPCM